MEMNEGDGPGCSLAQSVVVDDEMMMMMMNEEERKTTKIDDYSKSNNNDNDNNDKDRQQQLNVFPGDEPAWWTWNLSIYLCSEPCWGKFIHPPPLHVRSSWRSNNNDNDNNDKDRQQQLNVFPGDEPAWWTWNLSIYLCSEPCWGWRTEAEECMCMAFCSHPDLSKYFSLIPSSPTFLPLPPPPIDEDPQNGDDKDRRRAWRDDGFLRAETSVVVLMMIPPIHGHGWVVWGSAPPPARPPRRSVQDKEKAPNLHSFWRSNEAAGSGRRRAEING
uniref:Uncharacterized protein n=1 Tax=Globodera rostochiensis TaxID=31243 RepID=A0A914H9I5_GLORO